MARARSAIEDGRKWPGGPALLEIKLLKMGLTKEQVEGVVEIIDSVCNECWDSDRGCQCWNDE